MTSISVSRKWLVVLTLVIVLLGAVLALPRFSASQASLTQNLSEMAGPMLPPGGGGGCC